MNYNPKKASSNHISIKISSTLFKELNQLVFSQRLRNFPLPFIQQVWSRSVNMSHTVTLGRDQQQNTPGLLSPSAIT